MARFVGDLVYYVGCSRSMTCQLFIMRSTHALALALLRSGEKSASAHPGDGTLSTLFGRYPAQCPSLGRLAIYVNSGWLQT